MGRGRDPTSSVGIDMGDPLLVGTVTDQQSVAPGCHSGGTISTRLTDLPLTRPTILLASRWCQADTSEVAVLASVVIRALSPRQAAAPAARVFADRGFRVDGPTEGVCVGAKACSSSPAATFLARSAASWSPSPAATMDPFMRMCHWRAKPSA